MITNAILHLRYIELVRQYLGLRKNIAKSLPLLEQFPEIINIHIAELTAAINLFNRYRLTQESRASLLFQNTDLLINVLNGGELPSWHDIETKMLLEKPEDQSTKWEEIFTEIGQFMFPDWDDLSVSDTLGTLFVSFYRTYVLVSSPHARITEPTKDILIGLSIAEMLCLLAINGFPTNLFYAEKVWILHHADDVSTALVTSIQHI